MSLVDTISHNKMRRIMSVVIYVLMAIMCLIWLALTGLYTNPAEGFVDDLLVPTTQGPVRGYKEYGENLYIFYGIPYATAPNGPNKFKAPLPPPKWTEPFEAINKHIICPQISDYPSAYQQEDCLIANVYVPNTKEKSMPVVVYVHGGGFQMFFGDFLNHNRLLMEQNLVLVNFNYRLGPHGFLCLGTEDIPGNAGMKDQIALLQWVKKNIANFNGNPDDITIIGYSSGSTSVDLLLLSPLAKGLFNKAVMESGSSLVPYAIQTDPIETAWAFAKMMNYTGFKNDIYALEEFYKSCSYEKLLSINVIDTPFPQYIFIPCVERDVGEKRFLDDAPINILQEGKQQKLPILYSFSEMEGMPWIGHFETWKYKMNQKFSDFVTPEFIYTDENEVEQVAEQVKQFYFGDQGVNEGTIFRYIDYFSDAIFTYGVIKSIRFHVRSGNNNVYLYQYSFVQSDAPLILTTQLGGATHCAQTYAIADGNITDDWHENIYPEDFIKMKKTMRSLLRNFVANGNPAPIGSGFPTWPPVKANGGPHMIVDSTMKLKGPALQQRVLFWDSIYKRYYRTPIPPPTPPQRNKTIRKR